MGTNTGLLNLIDERVKKILSKFKLVISTMNFATGGGKIAIPH